MSALAMELKPMLAMRANAALVASMELLALSYADLEHLVARELAANPALERSEPSICSGCGAELTSRGCRACAGRHGERDVQPTTARDVAAELTLVEWLGADVWPQLAPGERPIAEYLLGSLDERGFLDADLNEVALAIDVPVDRLRGVLRIIQETGPPGVGARDARECLLLQLDLLDGVLAHRDVARAIVSEHLEELALGQHGAIADALGVTRRDVAAARKLIRERLRPYPLLPPMAGVAPSAAPEVVVRERAGAPGTFVVELLEPRRLGLGISPAFERLAPEALTAAERKRTTTQLMQAQLFLDRLERRWVTIRTVVEKVVEKQHGLVTLGASGAVPLTRRQVADELGMHESTVSRVVRGRHALLPSRRVIALEAFFDSAACARDALARVVAAEERPLSDAELAARLTGDGFPMARRTVAKYREQLGIPAHAMR